LTSTHPCTHGASPPSSHRLPQRSPSGCLSFEHKVSHLHLLLDSWCACTMVGTTMQEHTPQRVNTRRAHSRMVAVVVTTTIALAAATQASPTPGDGSYTIGPPYVVQPALTSQGRPRGVFVVVPFVTAKSKLFNGWVHGCMARPSLPLPSQLW